MLCYVLKQTCRIDEMSQHKQTREKTAKMLYLHVRYRADAHFLAKLPVAVEADVREGHRLAVHVGKLGRGMLELVLDRLGSAAQDGVELHNHQGVSVCRG